MGSQAPPTTPGPTGTRSATPRASSRTAWPSRAALNSASTAYSSSALATTTVPPSLSQSPASRARLSQAVLAAVA